MEAPNFIFNLFEKEIIRIQTELLTKVAAKYDMDKDALIQEFIGGVTLVPSSKIKIVVHKQLNPRTPPNEDNRCRARIWNRGRGGQCIRSSQMATSDSNGGDCKYCYQHATQRKLGTIDDPPDKSQFPQKPTSLYK